MQSLERERERFKGNLIAMNRLMEEYCKGHGGRSCLNGDCEGGDGSVHLERGGGGCSTDDGLLISRVEEMVVRVGRVEPYW